MLIQYKRFEKFLVELWHFGSLVSLLSSGNLYNSNLVFYNESYYKQYMSYSRIGDRSMAPRVSSHDCWDRASTERAWPVARHTRMQYMFHDVPEEFPDTSGVGQASSLACITSVVGDHACWNQMKWRLNVQKNSYYKVLVIVFVFLVILLCCWVRSNSLLLSQNKKATYCSLYIKSRLKMNTSQEAKINCRVSENWTSQVFLFLFLFM